MYYLEDLNFSVVFSLYQDGSGRHRLLIEWVRKSDAGWYTLSAINVAGMSSCNARLDVGSKTPTLVLHVCYLLHDITAVAKSGSAHERAAGRTTLNKGCALPAAPFFITLI